MNATRHPPPTPDNRAVTSGRPQRRESIALYDQPGIRITSEWFTIAGRRFPVGELTNLRTARGPHDPLVVRAVLATGIVLAGIGAALSFTRDLNHLTAPTYLALGAAAFVPVTLAVVGQRLRPPAFELWGQYHGMNILLFSTDEERQYGQVTRALLRAQEMSRLGGVAEPVASIDPWQHRRR